MIESIFGNPTAEKVLLYLTNYGKGYPTEIARTFGLAQSQVQKQLMRLEQGGVLASQTAGRMRLYEFNRRWPFRKELRALLEQVLLRLPADERGRFYRRRSRPRRPGKEL